MDKIMSLKIYPSISTSSSTPAREKLLSWHTLSKEKVLTELETTPRGLTYQEASQRLIVIGPNIIPGKARPTTLVVFLRQLTSPFVMILLILAVVIIFLEKFIDASVILGIVLINSLIGFFHERRAEQALEALGRILTPKARLRRNGKILEAVVVDIVPGDILLLSQGDRVPADARIISAKNLSVNESLLTGESLPERKETKPLPKDSLPLPDRKNMLYAGTLVESGSAEAVVVATGLTTELGKIAEAVKEAPDPPSLFERRLHFFGRWLVVVIGSVVVLFFLIGLFKNESPLTMFLTSTAMAVSLIPEGLPMVVTLALAVGVTRMARRQAITRRMAAVEGLGIVTTICTDKTGTLTKNEMTVREIITPQGRYTVSGVGFSSSGAFHHKGKEVDVEEKTDLMHLLTTGALVNESELNPMIGDHTEVALLVAATKAGLSKESLLVNHPRLDVLPFDSQLGFMATLHRQRQSNIIMVKGAPEVVLSLCNLSDSEKKHYLSLTGTFAREALRVLAVGRKLVKKDATLTVDEVWELEFLGLVAMEDPPREEASASVRRAQEAGIRVIMLTGDNLKTAQAIARKVGLSAHDEECADGEMVERLSDIELRHLVAKINVFARVSPLQKLRIVKALKSRGEIVGVTGDGINDAPALVQADIGIAMGQQGTDAAREASKIVLADDNFASIVAAVEEGRTIYNNIQRVILYLLSTSLGVAITIVFGFAAGLPLPLLPLQILWINFATDGFAGFPLAVEPKKEQVMHRPPLTPREPILNREMIIRIVLVGLVMALGGLWLFSSFLELGVDRARTITFVFLVVVQLFNILNVRSKTESILKMNLLTNRILIPALLVAFLMMLLVVYLPPISTIFQLVPLTLSELLLAVAVATFVIPIIEIRKTLVRKESRTAQSEKPKQPYPLSRVHAPSPKA
jgi:Ca2+-transporting ATPase